MRKLGAFCLNHLVTLFTSNLEYICSIAGIIYHFSKDILDQEGEIPTTASEKTDPEQIPESQNCSCSSMATIIWSRPRWWSPL